MTFNKTDATVVNGLETGKVRLGGSVPQIVGAAPAWLTLNGDGDVIADFGFAGQVRIETDRVKVFKRFLGWPNFIFDTQSPFFGKSAAEDVSLILAGPDLVAGTPNFALAADNF